MSQLDGDAGRAQVRIPSPAETSMFSDEQWNPQSESSDRGAWKHRTLAEHDPRWAAAPRMASVRLTGTRWLTGTQHLSTIAKPIYRYAVQSMKQPPLPLDGNAASCNTSYRMGLSTRGDPR